VEAQLQEGLHGGAGAIGVLPPSADDILGPRVRRVTGGVNAFFLGCCDLGGALMRTPGEWRRRRLSHSRATGPPRDSVPRPCFRIPARVATAQLACQYPPADALD